MKTGNNYCMHGSLVRVRDVPDSIPYELKRFDIDHRSIVAETIAVSSMIITDSFHHT